MQAAKVIVYLVFFVNILHGQTYFQQTVSYTIDAELDPSNDLLTAQMKLSYINQSGDELSEIYFHLYPNAFKDNNTQFAKDNIARAQRKFYFANEKDRGGFNHLSFSHSGNDLEMSDYEGMSDIAVVKLDRKLLPYESIEIDVVFEIDIPQLYSRFGKTKGAYNFMHWYPRVAVYDQQMWNPLPYLYLGEFYGEFADYQISLRLPNNYKVVNTGSGISEPSSEVASNMNTWILTAENVHDFAMVAYANGELQQETTKSIDGRTLTLNVLKQEKHAHRWDKVMDYLKASLEFYETNVGPYPYKELTVVQGSDEGHGNMEYPGLIVVTDRGNDRSLDYYINHEMGHMWFFGALGFNERAEPWLDEGLTTFFEHRYTRSKYGNSHYSDIMSGVLKHDHNMEPLHAYISSCKKTHSNQRADLPIREMSTLNYGICSYEQAARYYLMLQEFVGLSVFNEAIQKFYEGWKFKHPKTSDLKQIFEETSGKDLDWFFDDLLISDRKVDFSIEGIENTATGYRLEIQNKGEIAIPMVISGLRKGSAVVQKWMDPSIKNTGGSFESQIIEIEGEDIDQFVIDEGNLSFDVNRHNNQIKTKGAFKKLEPIKLSRARRTDNGRNTNLFLSSSIAFNTTDGLHLGPGLFNNTLPVKNFQFQLYPMYAFESKSLVGFGKLSYRKSLRHKKIDAIEIGLPYNSFHFSDFSNDMIDEINLRYQKLDPYVELRFQHSAMSNTKSSLKYRFIALREGFLRFNGPDNITEENNDWGVHEITFNKESGDALSKKKISLGLEQQSYKDFLEEPQSYLKATASWKSKFYFKEKKAFEFRLFGAGFITNTNRESSNFNNIITRGSVSLFGQGFNDYLYDGRFFTRGDLQEKRFFKNQIGYQGGGFKNSFDSSYRLGYSNNYMVAVNMSSHLPIGLPKFLSPLKVFLDASLYSTKSVTFEPLSNKFLYSAGLSYDLKYIKVHLPLVNAKEIQDIYSSEDMGLFQRITFSIDFPSLRFDELEEIIEF